MPLSDNHVNKVCLYYKRDSSSCRYLQEDYSSGKFYCGKLIKGKKELIDLKIDKFIKDYKDQGIDPYKVGNPLGNNCDGYPPLKYLEQGYDKD